MPDQSSAGFHIAQAPVGQKLLLHRFELLEIGVKRGMEQGSHFARLTAVLKQAAIVTGDADPLVEQVHHPLTDFGLGEFALCLAWG